jgi:C1A family cysteine protease
MIKGSGWVPDVRDDRDLHPEHENVKKLFREFVEKTPLPASVDMEEGFVPVYDQGQTNTCTANALAALVTYLEKKTNKKQNWIAPSRIFLYKNTLNLLQTDNINTGVYLRTAMESLVLFGAPPEQYWEFLPRLLPFEPPPFVYSMARSYRAQKYLRLDPTGIERELLVERIKTFLASGIPVAFGFYMFKSITAAKFNGDIPYPGDHENCIGGHAIVAAGYDDEHVIKNPIDGKKTVGAFRIRNSWGTDWGQGGYGWLPYQYVLGELAIDWWTLLKLDWFDAKEKIFSIPKSNTSSESKKKGA